MESFAKFILDNKIIGFFDEPITLKSGRQSNFYVNWRTATNDAFLLDQLTDFICRFITAENIQFDSIIGVPEGASKTAVLTSMRLAAMSPGYARGSHCVPMGRAKPKTHGAPRDKYFIGAPEGRVLVLEDTITTGLSLYSFIDSLRETGINVVGALCLTDRMEKTDQGLSVEDFLIKRYGENFTYYKMSEASSLLPLALKEQGVSSQLKNNLRDEFANFGAKPLNI